MLRKNWDICGVLTVQVGAQTGEVRGPARYRFSAHSPLLRVRGSTPSLNQHDSGRSGNPVQ